ncbi:PTS sugar transporter subunit IIA [Sinanaerobacter chloroacetimidivorans]|jgi:PTS system galactitol-specific IIA component|uniref:PTS sugar transporter subunit IIA n=1 Tax=Sinanaerobacter chloroacetimidivorans TaxID=2818044 RepID=A0A8J8B126_9FIRM|nr:PTS sugar transporter subunit IIA [Sinanaerobacter chloroacetimidivorans]MBR0598253.1 PTS sugar transporter subunit IIA [Sinanaerobacter chloroacetimidivorans]
MAIVFKELIRSSISAVDSEDVIRQVGKALFDNGFVKETYVDAVAEREKIYPTGLQLKGIAVAMPHTDSAHVNKPAICVAKLEKPVVFAHMGDPDTLVEAEIIFMMAIRSPDEQIDNLKSVLKVFTSEEATNEFRNAKDDQELFEIADKYLN